MLTSVFSNAVKGQIPAAQSELQQRALKRFANDLNF
jgi:hypothetical protein